MDSTRTPLECPFVVLGALSLLNIALLEVYSNSHDFPSIDMSGIAQAAVLLASCNYVKN